MGKFGLGYGSECHLLRYMGRHRRALDLQVLQAVGRGQAIDWLDLNFAPKAKPMQDAELTALDFVDMPRLQAAWTAFWPRTGTPMNWDGVGWLVGDGPPELLLVEAKANIQEIKSSTGAKGAGRALIEQSLDTVKQALGVPPSADWTSGYYQAANRIAALWFLLERGIPARLANIYFVGDKGDPSRTCPTDAAGWKPALDAQSAHLALPKKHPLTGRIHSVFLDVAK